MNHAFCNTCQKLVPADTVEREGRMYLAKHCPECGETETLISGNARRYMAKRALDAGGDQQACRLNCLNCKHAQPPTLIFIDITNRCNLNCPICINNTPSMGFLFEPPLEYFETIFAHYATYQPRPAIQLFGGEPTVRDDLFDIIKMAKAHHLAPRVVTNGLKLADEDYCRRLIQTRATILIAYDGANPRTYEELRGSAKVLDLKQKALANIRTIGGAKVTFMTCLARGFNDDEIPEIFALCHEHVGTVRAIYFMPLAHSWDPKDWDFHPERMTTEDVEEMVDDAFPDDALDFLPAGLLGQLPALKRCLRVKPLPFLGAHPNCESVYLLLSDGEDYVPLARYLKGTTTEMAQAFLDAEKRLASRVEALDTGWWGRLLARLHLKDAALFLKGIRTVYSVFRRHGRLDVILKGRGLGKVLHGLAIPIGLLFGRKSRRLMERHTTVHGVLQIIILPFEDKENIETDRLVRCPASFAFVDPEGGAVKSVPVCAWGLHKTPMMRKIADHYTAEAPKPEAVEAEG